MITIKISHRNKKIKAKNTKKSLEMQLPASGYDLQDAFERLAIEDSSKCHLDDVLTDVHELDKLFVPMFLIADDIPKLNVVAILLNALNSDEINVFSALLFKYKPQTIDEMVCIASHIKDAQLKYDYDNMINPTLTPYGYVEDLSEKCDVCDHCHDGHVLDEVLEAVYAYDDAVVFSVVLIPRFRDSSKPLESVIVHLPADSETLCEAFRMIGADIWDDMKIVDLKSRHQFFNGMFPQTTSIHQLNKLAKILIDMDIDMFCKFKAVMAYHGIISGGEDFCAENSREKRVLMRLMALAKKLDCYEFIPLYENSEYADPCEGWRMTGYGCIRRLECQSEWGNNDDD